MCKLFILTWVFHWNTLTCLFLLNCKLLDVLFPDASWQQEDKNQEYQWWKPPSQQWEWLLVPYSIQALNGWDNAHSHWRGRYALLIQMETASQTHLEMIFNRITTYYDPTSWHTKLIITTNVKSRLDSFIGDINLLYTLCVERNCINRKLYFRTMNLMLICKMKCRRDHLWVLTLAVVKAKF